MGSVTQFPGSRDLRPRAVTGDYSAPPPEQPPPTQSPVAQDSVFKGAGAAAFGGAVGGAAMYAMGYRRTPSASGYRATFDPPMSTATREAPMVDEQRDGTHGPSDYGPSATADHGSTR